MMNDKKYTSNSQNKKLKSEEEEESVNYFWSQDISQVPNFNDKLSSKISKQPTDAQSGNKKSISLNIEQTTNQDSKMYKYTNQAIKPLIQTNKTISAHLNCLPNEMILSMSFAEPFRGIVYSSEGRKSKCKFEGDGLKIAYQMTLPLKECGTKQVSF